jgi:antitoxin component YwqK of YwqJK toxin-antitoxin module
MPALLFAQQTDTIYTPQGKLYQVITTEGETKTIETFGYNGGLLKQETLENSKRNGTYKEYHSNGKLMLDANYKKGELIGDYKAYRQDGKLQSDLNYKLFFIDGGDKGLKDGSAKLYHYNGNLMAEGNYERGEEDGNWTYYNNQGWMSEQKVYKDGKMAGTHIQYYPNGQMQYRADVYEDVTVNNIHYEKLIKGWVRRYFKDGDPEHAIEMRNGENTGNEKRWWENGQLRFEGIRKEGNTRISNYYDQSGDLTLYLEETKTYQNGYIKWLKHGVERRFKDSVMTSENTFRKGESHGSFTRYSENGNLIGEGQTRKGKMIGTYKTYFYNGQLKSSQNKKYVIQWQGDTAIVDDGWYRRYFENGQVDYEALSDMGQEVYHAQYDERGALLKRMYKIHSIDWSQEYYPRGIIKSDFMNGHYYNQKALWFITGKPQLINATSHYPVEQTFAYSFDGNGKVLKTDVNGKDHPDTETKTDYHFNQNADFYQPEVADATYQLRYKSGQTRIETSIKNGLPHGVTKVYRPDGSLALYAETENGLSRGLSYYLSPKGDTLMRQIKGPFRELNRKVWSSDSSYSTDRYNERGVRLYHYETYPGGSPEILADNVNNIHRRWGPDGQVYSESAPVKGNPSLTWHKAYHPNGKLREKYTMSGTNRDGEYWLYHENGELFIHTFYRAGKQNGKYERYDESGNLFSRGEMVNGKKESIWSVTVNGSMQEQFYKNDKRQVSLPEGNCACVDTNMVSSALSFVPLFKDLLSYRQYKNAHPSFLNPLSEEQYGKLFYRSLYGSSAELIAFKPLSFGLGEYNQNTLVINRCHTDGYISVLPFSYIKNGNGRISLDGPRFELTFATKLMSQQGRKKTIQINTQAERAEFSEQDYIKTKDPYLEACFEPIKRKFWQLDEAKVKMLPNVKPMDAQDWFKYQDHDLEKIKGFPEKLRAEKETEVKNPMTSASIKMTEDAFTRSFLNQRLVGIVAVQGKGKWTLQEKQTAFELRYLWLTEDWAAGVFDLEIESDGETQEVNLKALDGTWINTSLEELQEKFLKEEDFDYVEVERYTGQNKLKVTFWVN